MATQSAQPDRLADALALLAHSRQPLHERLYRAGILLWNAYVFHGAHWPDALERRAADILSRLTAHDSMRATVNALDTPTARGLLSELQELIVDLLRPEPGAR